MEPGGRKLDKMAEIAVSLILKSLTIASKLIEDKIRGQILDELKYSDVSGQHLREFILRDLEEIKEKLDGLSRVDMLSSLNFFQDGIVLLQEYLKREKADVKSKFTSALLKQLTAVGISVADSKPVAKEEQSFESFIVEAKTKFQKSSDHAVKAVSNEALNTTDRVFAARLRIIATILEHMDDTKLAFVLCKSYLKEVNSMPEVVNNMIVQFGVSNISFRKIFNASERKDFIWSVVSLNRLLWSYAHFCQVDGSYYSDWPLISLEDNIKIHPVLGAQLRETFYWSFNASEPPSVACAVELEDYNSLNSPQGIAVCNGNFIIADTCNHCIKVFSCNGNSLFSCGPPPEDTEMDIWKGALQLCSEFSSEPVEFLNGKEFWPRCVVASKDMRIYSGSSRATREGTPLQSAIFVFDSEGRFIKSFGKEVFCTKTILTSMAIDQNGQLLVADDYSNCIHVFSLDGVHKSRICEWETHEDYSHLAVTDNGTILLTHWDHIRIYDHDGQFVSKYVAKEYGLPLAGIAFDSKREYIYVLCKSYKHLENNDKPNVQVYNKDWELEGLIRLPKSYCTSKSIAVTSYGFVGVVNVDGNEVIVV